MNLQAMEKRGGNAHKELFSLRKESMTDRVPVQPAINKCTLALVSPFVADQANDKHPKLMSGPVKDKLMLPIEDYTRNHNVRGSSGGSDNPDKNARQHCRATVSCRAACWDPISGSRPQQYILSVLKLLPLLIFKLYLITHFIKKSVYNLFYH
jgi:hypothetical protein